MANERSSIQRIRIRQLTPPPIPPDAVKRLSTQPPPIPADAKSRPIHPPVDLTSVAFVISEPKPALTVDYLVSQFSMEKLEEVLEILRREKEGEHFDRPASFFGGNIGEPGALIRHKGTRRIAVVGDLHANLARLDALLQVIGPMLYSENPSDAIELCTLGDIIHPEKEVNLLETLSSFKMFQAFVVLKFLFPERFNGYLGNHDLLYTRPEIMEAVLDNRLRYPDKGLEEIVEVIKMWMLNDEVACRMSVGKKDSQGNGYLQCILLLVALIDDLKSQGKSKKEIISVIQKMQSFFDALPLAMTVKHGNKAFYLSHAGIVQEGITQEQLINIRYEWPLMQRLLENKATERHYDAQGVEQTQKKLALTEDPRDTYIVTAHEKDPQRRNWGYDPFPRVNHSIIHGNVDGRFGYLMIENGVIKPIDIDVANTPAQMAY